MTLCYDIYCVHERSAKCEIAIIVMKKNFVTYVVLLSASTCGLFNIFAYSG